MMSEQMLAPRKSPPSERVSPTKRPSVSSSEPTGENVDTLQPRAKQFAGCKSTADFARPADCAITREDPPVKLSSDSPMVVGTLQASGNRHAAVLGCVDYRMDVIAVLKEREIKLKPRHNYMGEQNDINTSMRTILIDWLVEVTEEFKLSTETLHLATNYIDRFLSIMHVQRNKLQLVGTSSMLLACKLEEIHPPDVSMFVEITDNTYTADQVKTMEIFILRHLNYELSAPTSYSLLRTFGEVSNASENLVELGSYLCELALLNSEPFLQFLPSRTAAAALCLAKHTLEGDQWTAELERITGYTKSELSPVIAPLYSLLVNYAKCLSSDRQPAVVRKYSTDSHMGVASTATNGVPTSSLFETEC